MKKLCLLILIITNLHGTQNNITIEPLTHHPEIVEQLFELLYEHMIKEFDADYAAVKERYVPFLEKHVQDAELPLGFVALVDHKPIGLCCLRKNPVSTDEKCTWFKDHPEAFPWIAGLFVAPEYRGNGIAEALVRHTIQEAKELGFEKLYLFTQKESEEYETYIRYGCQEIDSATFIDDNKTIQLSIMQYYSAPLCQDQFI